MWVLQWGIAWIRSSSEKGVDCCWSRGAVLQAVAEEAAVGRDLLATPLQFPTWGLA